MTCRILLAIASFSTLFAVLLLAAPDARAGGGALTIPNKTMAENKDGEWHFRVRIDLVRAPPMMHTPMRFTFSKEAVDERAIMTKGAEPQHHRVVLEVPQKTVVSMDVDFADPSGKTWKSTWFEFDVRRKDNFFEAGEYLVSLNGPDGDVGGATRVTLTGDNPPVYRGAMDFSGDPKANKKKGPKIEEVSSGIDAGEKVAQNDTPAAAPVSGDVAAEGTGGDMVPASAYNKTAEEESVHDHPSGCGCVAAGVSSEPMVGAGLGLLGVGLIVARRRPR